MTHPLRPGFWMVRCARGCPEVAARIWLCNHAPDDPPENVLDRWPPYYPRAQIGIEEVDPWELWGMLEFVEADPAAQARMLDPPEVPGTGRHGRLPQLSESKLAKWRVERARRITQAEFDEQIVWLRWAERNQPSHPRFQYRKPASIAQVPLPLFEEI